MADTPDSALKTVERAVQLLDCFSEQEPELSIGELSRRLGVHKSMVSRLVATLRRGRLLQQDPVTRNVSVGGGVLRLSSVYLQGIPLESVAAPYIAELVNLTHHSGHLGIRSGSRYLIVRSVESPAAVRVILRNGEERFLHATAGGKLFLAYSPAVYAQTLAEVGLPGLTGRTQTSREKLDAELETVRRTGIAWNLEESHASVGAVAAPVFDNRGEVIGTVSLVFPVASVTPAERTRMARELKKTTQAISEAFGGKAVAPRRTAR